MVPESDIIKNFVCVCVFSCAKLCSAFRMLRVVVARLSSPHIEIEPKKTGGGGGDLFWHVCRLYGNIIIQSTAQTQRAGHVDDGWHSIV